MKEKHLIIFFSFIFLLIPLSARAVIPPDFVFNIGSQILQIFSIIALFFSTILGIVWQFIKIHFSKIKHKRIVLCISIAGILIFSFILAYAYEQYRQKVEYETWLQESNLRRSSFNVDKYPANPRDSMVSSSVKNTFFELHQNDSLVITNQQFQNLLVSSSTEFFVVDARENIEYENGRFPTSTHIRFADLKAGKWEELPPDKQVVVICWSGIRGKETVEFLRSKGIVAVYLEKGANGWVEFGGAWEGNIKFAQKYTERRYELVFSTKEVKQKLGEGAVLVDSREPIKFQKQHVPHSVSVSMFSTPTADLDSAFSQVPPGSRVITICDDYVNCFDAKVTGVELEKRGYVFLGRYNKPWEF